MKFSSGLYLGDTVTGARSAVTEIIGHNSDTTFLLLITPTQ